VKEQTVDGWLQISGRCWTSTEGYRIAAGPVRGVMRYCAYAPPLPMKEYNARLKVRYALGERVPQVRELINCFDSSEAARAACTEHAKRSAA